MFQKNLFPVSLSSSGLDFRSNVVCIVPYHYRKLHFTKVTHVVFGLDVAFGCHYSSSNGDSERKT